MVMRFLHTYQEQAYALLRMLAGAMFAFHGIQKVFRVLIELPPEVGSQLWIGGVIELTGGILILIGWQSAIAAFICSGQMAVAYFQFHWQFKMGPAFFPTINKGELAVLYCFVFLYIACRGSGIWSLDHALGRNRERETGGR
jgi:putative oxidoreductase